MKRYAIFGTGGCGRGVIPLARQMLMDELNSKNADLVFVDDGDCSDFINGYRVLGYSEWLAEPASTRYINIAISNSKIRESLVHRCLRDKVNFFDVCAENVVRFDDVKIGVGSILCPFVSLTSNISIGVHFHANLYSYVEHDCKIGDYVTFAPGVKCNGNVEIEDHVYIGAGALIKQGKPGKPLVIGRGAVIGMGAVVTKSIPAGAVVVGNPATSLIKV